MHFQKFFILIFLSFIISYNILQAQIVINFGFAGNDINTSKDLWNFTITNNLSNQQNTYLYINLRKEGSVVMTARTIPFDLKTGIVNCQTMRFADINYNYPDNNFQNEFIAYNQFPVGEYEICVSLHTNIDNRELTQNCYNFSKAKLSNPKETKKNINFNGYSEAGYFSSSHQAYDQGMPQNYGWFLFEPNIALYGAPFYGRVLLSSEESATSQNINTFSFNFDAATFRSNMQNRAIKILEEKQSNAENKLTKRKESLKELSKINKVLGNKEVQRELGYISKADSIRKVLDDPTISNKKADSLKGLLADLQNYERKKKAYENLMQKKKHLDSLSSKLSVYDTLPDAGEIDYKSLRDVKGLKSKLSSLGKLSRAERYAMSVNNFFVGTGFPQYSMFTLQGQPVNGVSAEIEPGNFYASATYGSLKRPVISSDIIRSSYERKITAGGVGMGNINKNYFRLYFLNSKDDPSSLPSTDIASAYYRPQSNQVISVSGAYEFIKDKLSLNAELAGSQFNRDIDAPDYSDIFLDTVPAVYPGNSQQWLLNIFQQKQINLFSATDYAYNIGLHSHLASGRTNINTSIKRVGPYYESFGLPFLYKDMKTYELQFEQSLLKNIVNITLGSNYSHNKLPRSSAFASSLINGNANLIIRIPKMPYFNISYKPLSLINDSMSYGNNIFSASSGYSYKSKNINHNTVISYLHCNSTTNSEVLKFKSDYYMLNHYAMFGSKISANLSVAYNTIAMNDSNVTNYIFSGAGSFILFKRLSNTLGANYRVNNNENKLGFYYDISIKLARYFTFNLRAENNTYDYLLYNPNIKNYQEMTIRALVVARW